MQWLLIQPAWLLVTAASFLGCLALALVVRAQFWRIGGRPHCKRCNYELEGLPNEKCPECGKVHGRSGPPKGRRRKRRLPFAAAVLLGAAIPVVLAPVYVPLLPANVFSRLPTPLVLFAADKGVEDAFAVIETRAASGAADPHAAEIALLVTRRIHALWVDTDASAPEIVQRWAGVFEAMYPRSVFSSAEIEAYFDAVVQYSLTLPETRSDDVYWTEVTMRSGLPSNTSRIWAFEMDTFPVSVGGRPYPGSDRPHRTPRLGGHPYFAAGSLEPGFNSAHNGSSLSDMGVPFGEHEAEVAVRQAVYDTSGATPVLIYDKVRTLTGRVSFVDGSLLPTVEEVRRMEEEAAKRANLFFDLEIAREFYRRNAVCVTPRTVQRSAGPQTARSFKWTCRPRFRPVGGAEWATADGAMGTMMYTYPAWMQHAPPGTVLREQLVFVSLQAPSRLGVGDVVDLELLPAATLAGPGADEQALGFGVRYEGIPVLSAVPPDTELFPAPKRILLLDHNGAVLEELPIDGDIWAAPEEQEGTAAEGG